VLGAEPRHDRIVHSVVGDDGCDCRRRRADRSGVVRPCRSGGPSRRSSRATPAERLRYAVVGGDSWFGIASRAGIGVGNLLEANDASLDDQLHPGDVLCLPEGAALGSTCAPGAATYTVRSGDGWFGIARVPA
jgi:hypothetical protein